MAESLKVPEDQFKAAIRALLDTPPAPMADIPRKREPKAKRAEKKKRTSWRNATAAKNPIGTPASNTGTSQPLAP